MKEISEVGDQKSKVKGPVETVRTGGTVYLDKDGKDRGQKSEVGGQKSGKTEA